MVRLQKPVFVLCLLWGVHTSAQAQVKESETRGGLLYSTHCNACHTAEIHWREKKLATDRSSLKDQVRRWQANAGLGWSKEEIRDVTRYLNATYYHFPVGGRKNPEK